MSGSIEKIGERICALRKAHGLTQEALGERLGISGQAVSKWEKGGIPDTYFLPLLADIFSVSTDELLGIEPTFNACNKKKIFSQLSNAFADDESDVADGCFEAIWSVLQGADPSRYACFQDIQTKYDGDKVINSKYFSNEGMAYLSFNKNFPILLSVNVADGLTEKLMSNENLWKLLDDLGNIEFRRLLLYSQSLEDTNENLLTIDYLSETLNIKEDHMQKLLDKFISYSLMKKHTAKINGKKINLYIINNNPYILPMLMIVSLICSSPSEEHSIRSHFSRNNPYFNRRAVESALKNGKI